MSILFRRNTLVYAGVTLAIAALFTWLFWPKAVDVDTARPSRGPIAQAISDQGVMRPREGFIIYAPVAGQLERLSLDPGDRISAAGAEVARLRPPPASLLDPRTASQARAGVSAAEAGVAAARANLHSAQAVSRLADDQLADTRSLAERGIAPAHARQTREAEARTAKEGLAAAEALLRARQAEAAAARAALTSPTEANSAIVIIRAPSAGVVTRVFQESARMVQPGEPLIEIGDRRGLEAAIEFLSEDAVRIQDGMPAEIYDWGGPPLPALVRRVEPQAFTKVSALGIEEQRVPVLLQLTPPLQPDVRLGAGYRVWGRVLLRQAPEALLIPIGALGRGPKGWSVFKVEGGRARRVSVTVGAMTADVVEVLSGLTEKDEIVVFPSDRVRDRVAVHRRRS
jgi:HlyD family secretion protein